MAEKMIRVPEGHEWLRGVLEKWQKLIADYSAASRYEAPGIAATHDAAYWWNETTLCGLFATACWQAGHPAIVERTTQTEHGDKRRGFVDLVIWAMTEGNRRDAAMHAAEAKWAYDVSADTLANELQELSKTLDSEVASVEAKLGDSVPAAKMGLMFVVPFVNLTSGRAAPHPLTTIEAFCGFDPAIEGELDSNDFASWAEPAPECVPRWSEAGSQRTCTYPGVLLIGRIKSA